MNGTIKTLTDRGFGFIAREGETKDEMVTKFILL